ncbi:unnamed protein product [Mytilus coruscus]|uniref:SWIM-type domain-containing protein n=1 Tax=Mytilus coruscus TaxID=42192 RepID=A0A6J8A8T7_MYTCO|nr:unnamed protein product [Mytilus coruscus]
MTSIQMLLAVFVIAALCGTGNSGNYQPKCYKMGGYCENKSCRKGFKCAVRYLYGCPGGTKCCLRDTSYNNYQGHRDNRIRGYCTNGGCRSGYNYYDNKGAFETNQTNNGVTASLSSVLVSKNSNNNDNVDIPPYNELHSGWTSDLSLLPLVSHQDVDSFLIDSSHRTGDNEQMLCYRQFISGYNFFKENYVHDLMINSIDDEYESCYIRSKCYPSMKQQGPYQQWILISKKIPVVVFKANCSCPARLGEGCSHFEGLLFKLEACAQELENTACTSKNCNWNKEAKLGNLNYTPALFDLVAPSSEFYDIHSDINVKIILRKLYHLNIYTMNLTAI